MGDTAAMGMMIGAGIGQSYSSYASGEYNAKIAEANARVADAQAKDAIGRGEDTAMRHRQDVRRLQGAQRARAAANGLDFTEGSAADLIEEASVLGEMDVQTIRNNAALEAWGFRTQSADARARASVAKAEGRNAAVGSILSTGAQATYFGSQTGGWNGWTRPKVSSRIGSGAWV